MSNVLVVGAGVAGLAAAYHLQKTGSKVVLAEKTDRVAGLARSYHYGPFTFDTGPHRFHTDYPQVEAFIREILGSNIRSIPRSSGVWMFGKYFDWPLTRSAPFKFPPGVMMRVGVDLLSKGFSRQSTAENFAEYIKSMYGKTIFTVFFAPYTEKFLHLPSEKLHSDWARAGVDRAIIDKKYNVNSLPALVKATLLPQPVETTFLYPEHGGVEAFALALAERFKELGGTLLLEAAPGEFEVKDGVIRSAVVKGERLAFDHLLWTGPLPILCRHLGAPDEGLGYLHTILYNVMIAEPAPNPYQWCYFGGYDTTFSRVSTPVNFSPSLAPPGQHGCCVEVTCKDFEDSRWQLPEALTEDIIRQMVHTGLASSSQRVLDVKIERIPHSYPIYEVDYRKRLERLLSGLAQFKNLLLFGRTGTFWYNNMDHSIKSGMEIAAALATSPEKAAEVTFREEFFR